MKSILDSTFKYYPAVQTDLRRTFRRVRQNGRTARVTAVTSQAKQSAPVALLPVVKRHRLQIGSEELDPDLITGAVISVSSFEAPCKLCAKRRKREAGHASYSHCISKPTVLALRTTASAEGNVSFGWRILTLSVDATH